MQPEQGVKYKEISHEQATILVQEGMPIEYHTCLTIGNYYWTRWPSYRDITPSSHHKFCVDGEPIYQAPKFRAQVE